MADIEEFAKNEHIHARAMPRSFVRPVSLDKVREHSNSKTAEQSSSMQTERSRGQNNDAVYQKLLEKKLTFDNDQRHKPHFVRLEDRTKHLYEEHALRQRKKQEVVKKLADEKLKECTFQPQICKDSDKGSKRTLEEFLNCQREHSKKTADRIQNVMSAISQMKTELEKEKIKGVTFHPKVNKILTSVGSTSNISNVHDRLYQKSRQKQEKQNLSASKDEIVKPKAKPPSESMTKLMMLHSPSSHSIGLRAANDVSRRQDCSHKKQPPPEEQHIITTSINSQKQLIHKIMKELSLHCSTLGIKKEQINYLQMCNLMVEMNFIKEQSSCNLNERRHLFQIWTMLGGQNSDNISLRNLFKIICSIMGLHNMKLVEKQLDNSDAVMFRESAFSNYINQSTQEFKFNIDERQSKNLKKTFENLYITQLNHESSWKRQQPEDPSFKPEISMASKELAERHRIRILQETSQLIKNKQIDFNIPENGEISHTDLLLIQKKAYEAKNKEKKLMKEESELEAQQNHKTIHHYTDHSTRYLDLYDLSKNRGQRRDRTADEIQAQKYKEQLTFKPNTSRQRTGNWQPVAKDVDKAIYRMYEGRRIKGEKQVCTKHQNERINTSDKSPLLYLNVNIDNTHTQRLSVYEHDDPNVLAEEFGSRFKLSHEAKIRLCELIRSEIRDLLCRIDK